MSCNSKNNKNPRPAVNQEKSGGKKSVKTEPERTEIMELIDMDLEQLL